MRNGTPIRVLLTRKGGIEMRILTKRKTSKFTEEPYSRRRYTHTQEMKLILRENEKYLKVIRRREKEVPNIGMTATESFILATDLYDS